MTYARSIALAGVALMLAGGPVLAQTGAGSSPNPAIQTPSTPSAPGQPSGAPSTIDPRTGLPTSQPIAPGSSLPSASPPSTDPGSTLTTPAPPQTPPPIPQTGPPRSAPPAGQPITPSTVDPRTGLPR